MENSPDSIECNKINIPEQPEKKIENNNNKNEKDKTEQNRIITKNKKESSEKENSLENKEKINYYPIIKEYLNKNAHDNEYISKINDNPDSLFEKMDETRFIIWETFLYNISSPSRKNSDSDVLCAILEREDQRVIKNDCKRTRVRESGLVPGFPKILEAFLTYYCTSKDIHYKQGLNEVFGPLILLKHKLKTLKFSKIYDLGEVFIDQFLPNYFYEKDLYSLQSSLGLFLILLKYHEPSVYNMLDSTEIRPEVYATNSITTLMTGKLKLDIVYEFIERIIKTQDPLIIHFILVALFIYQREMIINCDRSFVATLMTTLTINSFEELNSIFDLALKLREQTPYSYRILANKIGFLKKNNKDIKKAYEFYQPQSIPAMPIFPLEILNITNRASVECVDPECKNCKSNEYNIDKENEYADLIDNKITNGFLKFQENLESHICEKCDMKIEKKMKNILLDLRILKYDEKDDDTEKTGFLPMMINVDQDELKSEDFSKIITNRFLVERGIYHFIFLTSSTDTFSDFERNFYMDNLSELDKKKMMFGLIKQHKVDKELNLEDAQKNLTWKEIYKLKEYDNFRNTLKIMQKENFPYIGYVYGGFNEVHEESFKFDYELLFHNEENCFLCQEKKAKRKKNRRKSKREIRKEKKIDEEIKSEISGNLWEHKTKIKFNKINEIYKDQNISTHFCILCKYKNKNYENEKRKVLIILLIDEYLMEFYEFEKQKEYNDIEIGNDEKEKKRKVSEYYDLGKETNEEKDTELVLFEKASVEDIISLNLDNKFKNIVNISIREKIKDKEKDKDKKKAKRQSINIFDIIIDFSSSNDSKSFITSFKKIISNYKANKK